MVWGKHDTGVGQLSRHGFDDHSQPRWDATSTIPSRDGRAEMHVRITHFLDGEGQVSYDREMNV